MAIEGQPQAGQRYRLKDSAFATKNDANCLSVMVPLGGIVLVVAAPVEGNGPLLVEWEGKTLRMSARDLRDRGELVDEDQD